MTGWRKRTIMEMAREAGFYIDDNEIYSKHTQSDHELTEPLEAFAELVYEQAFIDGMQKQMQSSVDKAVNAMTQPTYFIPSRDQRTWVELTNEDIALIDWESLVTKKDCVQAIEAKLKEKNT
jgi:hypothetical protein